MAYTEQQRQSMSEFATHIQDSRRQAEELRTQGSRVLSQAERPYNLKTAAIKGFLYGGVLGTARLLFPGSEAVLIGTLGVGELRQYGEFLKAKAEASAMVNLGDAQLRFIEGIGHSVGDIIESFTSVGNTDDKDATHSFPSHINNPKA